MHAADHDWQSLRWLADIHQFVVSGGIGSTGAVGWQKAMAKARRLKLDGVIRQTLAVCSFLFGTPVPAPCSPANLPEHLHIFPQAPLPEDSPEATLAFRHLRVLTRPLDKVRYLATVIFAPRLPDRDFLHLPPSLGFLYYVIRPPRLVFKWVGRRLWK